MNKNKKIFIAGRYGFAGSSIEAALTAKGYKNIVGLHSKELDLSNQAMTDWYIENEKPDYVIVAAAKVGGIMANIQAPAEFIYMNLAIQSNLIHAAWKHQVKKLIFLSSSCVYPRECPQPMKEEFLLDGKVEPTNEGYAIAKIAGMKMCEMYNRQYGTDFISIMPCNLYGIGDDFHPTRSHVVAALIRKFHEAKMENHGKVTVWGTGGARREFLFNEDFADACLFLFENYNGDQFLNVGSGVDVSIRELAEAIKKTVGYEGEIEFDTSKPDGMPQKLMDVTRINDLGWSSKTSLSEGLKKTYDWFVRTYN